MKWGSFRKGPACTGAAEGAAASAAAGGPAFLWQGLCWKGSVRLNDTISVLTGTKRRQGSLLCALKGRKPLPLPCAILAVHPPDLQPGVFLFFSTTSLAIGRHRSSCIIRGVWDSERKTYFLAPVPTAGERKLYNGFKVIVEFSLGWKKL